MVSSEVGQDFDLEAWLRWGSLPQTITSHTEKEKVEYLEAYFENYLQQEIVQEAAVKNLPAFTRFLEICGILNGQQVNMAAVARDAGAKRPTVQGYFQTLEDTLLGFFLPAWKPRAKIKEKEHSKFYFFDCGVSRVAAGLIRENLGKHDHSRGFLLETLLLNEIRAQLEAQSLKPKLSYWGTPSGAEVDLILQSGKYSIGIEIKSGTQWKREFNHGLLTLLHERKIQKAFGVYCGSRSFKEDKINILKISDFFAELGPKGSLFDGLN